MPQQLAHFAEAMQAQLAAQQAQLAAQQAATQAQHAEVLALIGPIAVSVAESYNTAARVRNIGEIGDIVWPKLTVGAVGAVPAPNAAQVIRSFANLAVATMARLTYYVDFYGLAPAGVPSVREGRLLLRAFV